MNIPSRQESTVSRSTLVFSAIIPSHTMGQLADHLPITIKGRSIWSRLTTIRHDFFFCITWLLVHCQWSLSLLPLCVCLSLRPSTSTEAVLCTPACTAWTSAKLKWSDSGQRVHPEELLRYKYQKNSDGRGLHTIGPASSWSLALHNKLLCSISGVNCTQSSSSPYSRLRSLSRR